MEGCWTKLALFIWIVLILEFKLSHGFNYTDLKNLVQNQITWGQEKIATKESCDPKQCIHLQPLCQNDAKCVITKECDVMCECKPGFTGHFCGSKVPSTLSRILTSPGTPLKSSIASSKMTSSVLLNAISATVTTVSGSTAKIT